MRSLDEVGRIWQVDEQNARVNPDFGCGEDSLHFTGACSDVEVAPLVAFDNGVFGIGVGRSNLVLVADL